MRQHATARITQALQGNSALNLEAPRAEAGASKWESELHHSSSSKSAYLSKLANAVSQIKRASDVACLDVSSTAFEPNQAMPAGQHDMSAQDQSNTGMLTQHGSGPQDHAAAAAGQHQPSKTLHSVSEDELVRLMQLLGPGKTCSSRHCGALFYLTLLSIWSLLCSNQQTFTQLGVQILCFLGIGHQLYRTYICVSGTG